MSWFCENPRFSFVHVPRAAGTSILEALAQAFPLKAYPAGPGIPEHVSDHYWQICPGYGERVLACVRNPFARELSFYFWNQRVAQAGSQEPIHLAARRLPYKEYLRFRLQNPRAPRSSCGCSGPSPASCSTSR